MVKRIKKAQRRSDQDKLFLGVDGGGTKTKVVLMDINHQIVATGLGGPSNPLRVGVDAAVDNIMHAFVDASDKSKRMVLDVATGVFGLAGVRRQDIRDRVRERLIRELRTNRVTVVPDAEIAWFASTRGAAGVVVISGTGSICYGKDSDGNAAVAGGWGPIAGDEGSGINISKNALRAIAKASDGRAPETRLAEVASDYFRASNPEDLIVAIASPQMDNKRLAGFARSVIEIAKQGDDIAMEIVSVAGYELGLAASAVIRKLGLTNQKIPVGMVGSIFKAGEILKAPMLEIVNATAPKAYLKEPELEPAQAAAELAYIEYIDR
ncbi:MAG: BadF/BadG/BcrA/BcrD ATPase family protein [Pyrinomonadaceae bacterium]